MDSARPYSTSCKQRDYSQQGMTSLKIKQERGYLPGYQIRLREPILESEEVLYVGKST